MYHIKINRRKILHSATQVSCQIKGLEEYFGQYHGWAYINHYPAIINPDNGVCQFIKIPQGTPSGRVFHLKGTGVPKLGGYGKGDQYVTVFVDVPKKLTPRQKELLREFAEISGEDISKKFMDKIKDIFIKEAK